MTRGQRQCTCAPDRRTPHIKTSAWDSPAASTPPDAISAAATALCVGSTVTRVQRFRRIGAPADRMKRFLAFSTPDRCA